MTSMATDPREIRVLRRTRELLAEPENWLQGRSASDARGSPVQTTHPDACCFCLTGAIDAAGVGLLADNSYCVIQGVAYRLSKLTGLCRKLSPAIALPMWNDDATRTHADVLALIDRALGEYGSGLASRLAQYHRHRDMVWPTRPQPLVPDVGHRQAIGCSGKT
jgi:hypothetical protein